MSDYTGEPERGLLRHLRFRRLLGGVRFLFLLKVVGGFLTWVGFWTLFVATELVPVFVARPKADIWWLADSIGQAIGQSWSWLQLSWLVSYPVIPVRGDFPAGDAYGLVAYALAAGCLYTLHRRYGVFSTDG